MTMDTDHWAEQGYADAEAVVCRYIGSVENPTVEGAKAKLAAAIEACEFGTAYMDGMHDYLAEFPSYWPGLMANYY